MPLRARVGRHGNTGDNCQNWKEDQEAVIVLLNRIPLEYGGTQGALGRLVQVPVVPGIASDELFNAINRFQHTQFGRTTGFIEPMGRDLARLELLASRPAAPPAAVPPKRGQWADLKSRSVKDALKKALNDDDLEFSHAEIVDIIRGTVTDGMLSDDEFADLKLIKNNARSLQPRSKDLLNTFESEIKWLVKGGRGPYHLLGAAQQNAADRVCDFLKRSSASYFPKLRRNEVGVGLLLRIGNPSIMSHGDASLCAPAALLFNYATDAPALFARFAIDLFEKGKGTIYRLEIEPGSDCRNYLPEGIPQVDWLTMASIRDSENWFFDYDSVGREAAGITMPGEMAHWFRRAGYSDVHEETNLYLTKGTGTIDAASDLFAKGYRIVLLINDQMLYASKQTKSGSVLDRHWVVLRSPIDRSGGKVSAKVYSWGDGHHKIPQGDELSVDDFLKNFFGYVAAKP